MLWYIASAVPGLVVAGLEPTPARACEMELKVWIFVGVGIVRCELPFRSFETGGLLGLPFVIT